MISQPYIYRLFADKQALFAGAVFLVSEVMTKALTGYVAEAGLAPRTPEAALRTARPACQALIRDRVILRFLMHANCAAEEPLVGEAVRWCYAKQVELVRQIVGSDGAVRQWFGAGMLENVALTLGLAGIDEPRAHTLSGRSPSPVPRAGAAAGQQ